MPKLDITDSQSKILDKIYDRGHDVLYNGVASTSNANYIPANNEYKTIVDTPPVPGMNIEETTKVGSRVAAAAVVAHVTPSIHIMRATATSIIGISTPANIISGTKSFNSKQRRVLVMFSGYATASATANLTISPWLVSAPVGDPYTFTITTSGTNLYGSWEIILPDTESALIGLYARTDHLTASITLAAGSNQVVTIYG